MAGVDVVAGCGVSERGLAWGVSERGFGLFTASGSGVASGCSVASGSTGGAGVGNDG